MGAEKDKTAAAITDLHCFLKLMIYSKIQFLFQNTAVAYYCSINTYVNNNTVVGILQQSVLIISNIILNMFGMSLLAAVFNCYIIYHANAFSKTFSSRKTCSVCMSINENGTKL